MAYSIDSRTIKPGDVFIPIKGPNFDGHAFIETALAKGASKVLDVDLSQFAREQRAKLKIPIIGVTGSAGKTTVKDLLAAVLGQKFKVFKSPQNQNNEIGVPLSLINIEPQYEIAILELAMRGLGQIDYLTQIAKPTHAIITNIGYTHLELLGTREAIALAKSEIIGKHMKIFLNARDDYFEFLKERAQEQEAVIIPFSYDNVAQANIAAVSAVAKEFGLTSAQIEQGLSNYQASAHRLTAIKSKTLAGATIIDDSYNSNPAAVAFALEQLAQLAGQGLKIAVLGDMKELGVEAKKLHAGLNLTQADIVIGYGELAQNIPAQHYFKQGQETELIAKIKELATPGSYVLVKGSRSMSMEKIVAALS